MLPDLTLGDLPLFGKKTAPPQIRDIEAPPFVHGSDTSRTAAVRIRSKADTLRERVFLVIQRQGDFGCTDNEGIERSGIGGSTWRPRRVELQKAGRIEAKEPLRNGCTVWVAAAAGEVHAGI